MGLIHVKLSGSQLISIRFYGRNQDALLDAWEVSAPTSRPMTWSAHAVVTCRFQYASPWFRR